MLIYIGLIILFRLLQLFLGLYSGPWQIQEFKVFFLSDLKAYVQQLESSRSKLAQLEQELQRARQQVKHFYMKYRHLSLNWLNN